MSNSPLDRGRVCAVVEQYPDRTGQLDQNGQPKMKNRYATLGRATLWPAENGSTTPNVQIEIDSVPVGLTGSLKLSVFWDSDKQDQQQAQGGYQQQPQQGQYQQQPAQGPQYGNGYHQQ